MHHVQCANRHWRIVCCMRQRLMKYERCAQETDELHMRQPRTNDVQQKHLNHAHKRITNCVLYVIETWIMLKRDWSISYATATHQWCAIETYEVCAKDNSVQKRLMNYMCNSDTLMLCNRDLRRRLTNYMCNSDAPTMGNRDIRILSKKRIMCRRDWRITCATATHWYCATETYEIYEQVLSVSFGWCTSLFIVVCLFLWVNTHNFWNH